MPVFRDPRVLSDFSKCQTFLGIILQKLVAHMSDRRFEGNENVQTLVIRSRASGETLGGIFSSTFAMRL